MNVKNYCQRSDKEDGKQQTIVAARNIGSQLAASGNRRREEDLNLSIRRLDVEDRAGGERHRDVREQRQQRG